MNRSIVVYAIVLLAALWGAYHTWTHEDELALADAVVIMPGKPDELESLVYKSEATEVTLTTLEDAAGRYTWVRAVPLADPKPVPGDPHAAAPVSETEEFKAGAAVDRVVEAVAPFVAKRKLEVDDLKLDELGLADPEATLTITRASKAAREFELGGSAFGGSTLYVRDPVDGSVFLVDSRPFTNLKNGKRTLLERKLTGIPSREIRRITVTLGEQSVAFEQHNPDDADAVYWSAAGGDEADPAAAAWIDKTERLSAASYVQAGSEPQGLEEAFAYAVVGEDDAEITVRVYRVMGDEGEDEWYARSEHTRALVKVSKAVAAEAAADVMSLFGDDGAS